MRGRLRKMAVEAVAVLQIRCFPLNLCVLPSGHTEMTITTFSPAANVAATVSELLTVVLHRIRALTGRLLVLWLCRCDLH